MLQRWEELPVNMQIPEVRSYWEVLNKHRYSLALKRAFDLFASLINLQEHFQVSSMPFQSVSHALPPALNIISYLFNCWEPSERWASMRSGNIENVEMQSMCTHVVVIAGHSE